ncbi:glutamate-gated kainate-type ion channel receptor subunit GluR5 [Cucumis melo var. makuwa]|uniref:Glutamate-gated kainate-type ion channel receptor subunit GluR5 n=1 Tax=Cucumis melo var. makuwa TaxID=1194695 RepID=A0A5D3DI56_CUCMM|nr:glutamate-gated kainate-type ion channel receptor subunit GluR5 [Cucumis melo var. makuwa]
MLLAFNFRFILFLTLILALTSISSDAARVPTPYWEQMLPKKLPSPSSAPSKGTNTVAPSSSKPMKVNGNLPAKDGNV